MTLIPALPQHPNRLRVLFPDTDMTFPLWAGATYADIAATLADPAPRHHGQPLAIEVRLTRRVIPMTRPLARNGRSRGGLWLVAKGPSLE